MYRIGRWIRGKLEGVVHRVRVETRERRKKQQHGALATRRHTNRALRTFCRRYATSQTKNADAAASLELAGTPGATPSYGGPSTDSGKTMLKYTWSSYAMG